MHTYFTELYVNVLYMGIAMGQCSLMICDPSYIHQANVS